MRNLWMNMRRYKALILAALPFLIAGVALIAINTAEGWDRIGYLVYFLFSFPFLVAMSVLSVIFAYSVKDPKRRFIRTAKIASIASATVFVGVAVIGFYGAITSVLGF